MPYNVENKSPELDDRWRITKSREEKKGPESKGPVVGERRIIPGRS